MRRFVQTWTSSLLLAAIVGERPEVEVHPDLAERALEEGQGLPDGLVDVDAGLPRGALGSQGLDGPTTCDGQVRGGGHVVERRSDLPALVRGPEVLRTDAAGLHEIVGVEPHFGDAVGVVLGEPGVPDERPRPFARFAAGKNAASLQAELDSISGTGRPPAAKDRESQSLSHSASLARTATALLSSWAIPAAIWPSEARRSERASRFRTSAFSTASSCSLRWRQERLATTHGHELLGQAMVPAVVDGLLMLVDPGHLALFPGDDRGRADVGPREKALDADEHVPGGLEELVLHAGGLADGGRRSSPGGRR